MRNFDSSYLSFNFNNSNLIRSSDWKLRTFHMTKSGVLSPVPLLKLMSKFWSSDVNLSDKDSAIKLGAIINIDFFEINSKTRFLISYTKLTNNYCKNQP